MNVAFLCYPYHRGGVTRWMADMAIETRRQGGKAWFVAPEPRSPFVNGRGRPTMVELFSNLAPDERPTIVAPIVGPAFEFGTAAYRASVYAAALQSGVPADVPVIVSNDPDTWAAAAYLSPRNPMIAVLHGNHVINDRLVLRYGRATAAIACVSARVNRRTDALGRPGNAPLVTIPCGIPLRPMPSRAGGASQALRLAWVGRMDEAEKRVSDLPKIAAQLRDAGVTFTFDLMGDGPARESLARAFDALDLGDRVRLHPWSSTNDVLALLAQADLLLMSSNSEGMSITVMEALSMGCGIVSSRVSGVEDYESHPAASACLWIYDIGDVSGAVERIRAAARIQSPTRADAARTLAESEFSIGVCAQRYAQLFTRLAPTDSVGHVAVDATRTLTALASLPVAAQRLARLYVAARRGRSRSTPSESSSVSQVA
jgi:glycosyltransferase involved in cell wall biosynthesis